MIDLSIKKGRRFLGIIYLLLQVVVLGVSQSNENVDTPYWAEIMYQEMDAEHPKVDRVLQLYEAYYKTHTFKKNKHTWHFKMWVRNPESYGLDLSLHNKEQDRLRSAYTQKRSNTSNFSRAGTTWQPIGPIQNHDWTGSVKDEITHVSVVTSAPSDPNIMFCGTEGGEVYKSIDAGNSWACVSFGPELLMTIWDGVTAMAIHPTNPDIVYVAGEGRFYKSIDGGVNWLNLSGASGKAYRMVIHANHPDTILWSTRDGLYRSTNAGGTITQVHGQRCYEVEMHPNHPDSMYMVSRNNSTINPEFYVSADAGQTWTLKTNGWYSSAAADRKLNGAAIAISPSHPHIIYALLLGDSTASDAGLIGICKSTDAGDSWSMPLGYSGDPYTSTHINYSGWSDDFLCEIVVSNTNPNHLIVGTTSTYKSLDGGLTFVGFGGYDGYSVFGIHPDIRDVYQDGNNVWIATDGGINLSTDFYTNSADKMGYGLHGQDFWGFGIGWHEDVMVGGLFHNGVAAYYQDYQSRHFVSIAGGEPPTGDVNPSQNRLVYYVDKGAIIPDSIGKAPTLVLNRPFRPYEIPWPAYSSRLEFHPNSYNTFYQGTDNKLWKTIDGGGSMTLVKDFYTPTTDSLHKVCEIEISSSNPNVMYITRAQYYTPNLPPQLWKTTDAGQNWTQLNLPINQNGSRAMITIDPTNENNIWMGFASGLEYMGSIQNGMNGAKVFQSIDGGVTWTNLTSSLLDGETCHDIVHIAGTDGGVYFCSQNSIFYKNNTMPNWVQDNANLPFYIDTNIGKVWYKNGKFRIATYGRGVWENDLYDTLTSPIARIMVDYLEKDFENSICTGTEIDSFYFDDHSYMTYENGAANTWAWQFPTGSPSSSALRNPAVYFGSAGLHMAVLTVTDKNGMTDSDTLMVNVNLVPMPTLIQEGFEQGIPTTIRVNNNDGAETWGLSSNNSGGYGASNRSILMDNYSYNQPGEKDDFEFNFNLSTGTNSLLSFDVAYTPYSATLGDSLKVLVSTDCGLTYQVVYVKSPTDLATVPIGTSYPNANTWRTDSIDLTAYIGTQELIVVFRNINGYGNRLYIDNINIENQNIVKVVAPQKNKEYFGIFPNPVKAGCWVNYTASNKEPFRFQLFDAKGKQVLNQWISGQLIEIPRDLSQGMYFYIVEQKRNLFKGKVVVN